MIFADQIKGLIYLQAENLIVIAIFPQPTMPTSASTSPQAVV